MTTTKVALKFQDVLGRPLNDHTVVADIFDLHEINHFQVVIPLSGGTDFVIALNDAPPGVYRFELSPVNYEVIQFFLTLPPGGSVVRDKPVIFPVDADHVVGISAPDFGNLPADLKGVLNSSQISVSNQGPKLSGAQLYSALPPKWKAAVLNLYLKSSSITVGDGADCFDHITKLVEIAQDRFFGNTTGDLLEEASASSEFHSADFSLHKEIPPYHLVASFKTFDAEGNLQLTFSRNGTTGNDYLVDTDIDEAQGFMHIFEVARNFVAGLTNPYRVREILAMHGLKPLYDFQFAQRKAAALAEAASA